MAENADLPAERGSNSPSSTTTFNPYEAFSAPTKDPDREAHVAYLDKRLEDHLVPLKIYMISGRVEVLYRC